MLLGKNKPGGDDGEGDSGEEPGMPPLEDVMRELIDAVKADDPKAAAKAFRGAMACADGDEDEPDEDDTEA